MAIPAFLAALGSILGTAGGATAAGGAATAASGAASAAGASTVAGAAAGATAAAPAANAAVSGVTGQSLVTGGAGVDLSKISLDSVTSFAQKGDGGVLKATADNQQFFANMGKSIGDSVGVSMGNTMNTPDVNREGSQSPGGTASGINRKYNALAKTASKLADFDKDTPPFLKLNSILRLK